VEVTVAPDGLLIQGAKLFDGHRFRPPGCLLAGRDVSPRSPSG
jgi:hypothetical protein